MNSVAILSFWYFVQKNFKSLQQSKYKNFLPKSNKLNHNLAIILDLDEETSDHSVMVVDYCIESPLFCSTTQVVWGREPKGSARVTAIDQMNPTPSVPSPCSPTETVENRTC